MSFKSKTAQSGGPASLPCERFCFTRYLLMVLDAITWGKGLPYVSFSMMALSGFLVLFNANRKGTTSCHTLLNTSTQAFEFEVLQMQLILPIKMRAGGDRSGGSVHAGISSRCVAKSRLGIESVSVQNKSCGGYAGLLRVAASSNISNGRLVCPILPFLQVNATEPTSLPSHSAGNESASRRCANIAAQAAPEQNANAKTTAFVAG